MCEPREERRKTRQDLLARFGADVSAYTQWVRYGTAGAPREDAPRDTSIGFQLDGRTSSQQHSGGDDAGADAQAPNTNNATDDHAMAALADSSALCALEDVRTDDLIFNITRSYPAGYWGDTPISDAHGGRCGSDLETLAWRLLNCERISRELPPVDCDLRLVWISRQHADDMASRGFFGHVNPDGQDAFHRLTGRGIYYGLAGENLARQSSILEAHIAWMRSPLHRRNILTEQYHYAGIGVVPDGRQLLLTEAFVGGIKDEDDAAKDEATDALIQGGPADAQDAQDADDSYEAPAAP